MKNKISFLAVLAFATTINYTNASECIDNDCELNPTVIAEEVEVIDTSDTLIPNKVSEPIWSTDVEQVVEKSDCEDTPAYICPFKSETECAVWRAKPVYKQAVNPREPHINAIKIDDIICALNDNPNASANEVVFEPLIERYKILMRASKACCTDGILYKMREQKASDKQIYNFLKDDANYFAVGARCLVMSDYDISDKYSNGVNGDMVSDVRNSCLCKNRKWFDTLLSPFKDIYDKVPGFASKEFQYNYFDGLKRNIIISVNQDIQNALDVLDNCPD